MKRMDFVQNGYSGTIFLVTQGEDELQLWDFQAWLKGYYDAYIPFSDIDPLDYKVIGNYQDNPELLPNCLGVNADGQPKHPLYIAYDVPIIKYKVEAN